MSSKLRTLSRLPVRWIKGLVALLSRLIAAVGNRLQQLRRSLSWLTFNQKVYLISALALLLSFSAGESGIMGVVDDGPDTERRVGIWMLIGLFAGIAVCRELWQIFQKIWSTTVGKALILVLYAGTANFALAVAGQKVNHVAGIEPGPLIFTTGFTALLMLPFWILGSTLVFSSIALLITNLWLALCILLRIVRVKLRAHWEETHLVIVTLIARIILIPVFNTSLAYFLQPYSEEITIFKGVIASLEVREEKAVLVVNRSSDEEHDNSEPFLVDVPMQIIEGESFTGLTVEPGSAEEAMALAEIAQANTQFLDGNTGIGGSGERQWTLIDNFIAYFIYFFETYPSSACQKNANERVLPIVSLNEESMLSATLAPGSDLGVEFSVKPCIPHYSEAKMKDAP